MKVQIARLLTAPITVPGMEAGQQVTQALSIGLLLSDGRAVWGDCVGTELPLDLDEALESVRRVVAPALEGRELAGFRALAAEVEPLRETRTVTRSRRLTSAEGDASVQSDSQDGISRRALLSAPARLVQAAALRPAAAAGESPPTGQVAIERPLHPALRYGLSQALLQAVSIVQGRTMTQVVADEWGLGSPQAPVPILTRSTYDGRHQEESMIRHRAASLPHASIDDVAAQVGADGGHLTRYLHRLKAQLAALGSQEYGPAIHLDLAGALGEISGHHPGHMLGHLHAWRFATDPYSLRVEDPVLLGDRQSQIEALRTLHHNLRLRKIDVQLVARRWIETPDDLRAFLASERAVGASPSRDDPPADMIHLQMPQLGSLHNTVEAVLACQRAGIGVLLGGAVAETDLATRVAVHVALAAQPDLFLARPGTDVGPAISLARNEMARTLATIAAYPPLAKGSDGLET